MRIVGAVVIASGLAFASPVAAQDAAGQVYRAGSGVSIPVPVEKVTPRHPGAAQKARIEGIVGVECVVELDGSVSNVTVTRPLDPLLDPEAVAAITQWKFLPGLRNGEPVRVLIELEVEFAMRAPAYASSEVDVLPVPERRVDPEYPEEMRRDGVRGTVRVECVVLPDGRVGATRVVERLDPAMDEAALRAIKQWRFKPSTKDGVPVPVRIQLEMRFALR